MHAPWWRPARKRSAARCTKSVCGLGAATHGVAGGGAARLTRVRSGRLVSWTAISRNSAQNIPVPQAAPAAGPSPMRTPPRPLPPLAAPPRAPPAPAEPDINTFQVPAPACQRPAFRAPTLLCSACQRVWQRAWQASVGEVALEATSGMCARRRQVGGRAQLAAPPAVLLPQHHLRSAPAGKGAAPAPSPSGQPEAKPGAPSASGQARAVPLAPPSHRVWPYVVVPPALPASGSPGPCCLAGHVDISASSAVSVLLASCSSRSRLVSGQGLAWSVAA